MQTGFHFKCRITAAELLRERGRLIVDVMQPMFNS